MAAAGEIIVVVPTERESAALRELGVLRVAGVRLEHCGVGMAECAAAVSAIIAEARAAGGRPRLMILAGIAGAYSDAPAVGETVVVGSEIVADLGRFSAFSAGGFVPLFQREYLSDARVDGFRTVRGATVSTAGWLLRQAQDPDGVGELEPGRVGELVEPPLAEIENMEGAAFMAVCARFGVPALEVRTISNRVGDPIDPADFDLAAENLARDLEKIVAAL